MKTKKKEGRLKKEEKKQQVEEEQKKEVKKEPPKPILVWLYETSIHDLLVAIDKMMDYDFVLAE